MENPQNMEFITHYAIWHYERILIDNQLARAWNSARPPRGREITQSINFFFDVHEHFSSSRRVL
ncbi:MAG: hypothetical protein A2061_02545 [Gallionellales bacterium GWA2_59_43]|nr:MAG: hypothetical protein A2061_02545 [Gallionellales bacterium GWA2_59_43]